MTSRQLARVLVVLLAAGLMVAHWGQANAIRWEYVLRPLMLPAEVTVHHGSGTLKSAGDIFSVELESLTLNARGFTVRGLYRQDLFAEYVPRTISLSVYRDTGSTPRWGSWITADGRWILGEDGLAVEWFFPYSATGIGLGDDLLVALTGFTLGRSLEVRQEVAVDQLRDVPFAIGAGQDGHLEVREIRLDWEEGGLVVAHVPGNRLTSAVEVGAEFHLTLGAILDDRGERYGPHGGSGTGGPGQLWVENLVILPVDTGRIQHLVFNLHGATLLWAAPDPLSTGPIQLRLPRRVF